MRRAIQRLRELFWRGHLHLDVRRGVISSHLAQAPEKTIAVFGDSRVEQALLPATIGDLTVVNAGIGSATVGLLAKILPSLLNGKRLAVSVVSLGINNSKVDQTANDNFLESIDTICSFLEKHSDRVILTTIPPVLRSAPLGAGYFDPSKIAKNNEAIKLVATKRGLSIVDIAYEMSDENSALRIGCSIDGVHFTPDGYAVWTSILEAALSKSIAAGKPG